MATLLETLTAQLERPRELSARVLNYIGGTYGIDHDDIGGFLVDELPKLEDYEIDLILSPTFTPKLTDQAVFAELLGSKSIPRDEWPALIQALAVRPTRGQLVTSDGRTHTVALREITLERYVYRLRLDGTISEPVLSLLDRVPPRADRPLLQAIARQSIWENTARTAILARYITNAAKRDLYSLEDAIELLNAVESYEPGDLEGLLKRIPPRQDVLRTQINAGSKPFFSQRVEEMHGGERDQRRQYHAGISAKENELAFLDRLQRVLAD